MKKRLSILISLALVALLSIAVIVMVFIQVNYKPQINEPYSVIVTQNGGDNFTFTKTGNETTYNNIIREFENSFTRSYLSAFFSGQVSGNAIVTQITDTDFNELTFSDYKIEFTYTSAQTLQANGQTLSKTYDKIIFGVSNNSTYKETTIYFQQIASENHYVLTTYALQNSFYDYLETLFE